MRTETSKTTFVPQILKTSAEDFVGINFNTALKQQIAIEAKNHLQNFWNWKLQGENRNLFESDMQSPKPPFIKNKKNNKTTAIYYLLE